MNLVGFGERVQGLMFNVCCNLQFFIGKEQWKIGFFSDL